MQIFDCYKGESTIVDKIFEYRSYGVKFEEGNVDSVSFLGLPLEQDKQGLWRFKTPFAVGMGLLEWISFGKERFQKIEIHPDPYKLQLEEEWTQMVEDLSAWAENLLGHQGVRGGSVVIDGLQNYLATEALLPLSKRFIQHLRHLFFSLREKTEYPGENIPVHAMRPPFDSYALQSNPHAVAWLRGRVGGQHPYVHIQTPIQTYNHPANRYIVWLIRQVLQILKQTSESLRKKHQDEEKDVLRWRDISATHLDNMRVEIEQTLWASPIAHLKPEPIAGGSLLVILNDPMYRSVHSMGRLLLSGGFRSQAGLFSVSLNTSYQIYEVWCFREVMRQLEVVLGVEATQRESITSLHQGMKFMMHYEGIDIELAYNPTFISHWAWEALKNKGKSPRLYSLINEQRPDITIHWTFEGRSNWLALDAKYRTSRKNLMDAFSSAFSYRLSLIDRIYGGHPLGCFLLVPKIMKIEEDEKVEDTHFCFLESYRREHRFGAMLCNPKQVTSTEIGSMIQRYIKMIRE